MVKPCDDIYRAVTDKMGCAPEDVLFIDDSVINCDGAVKNGMHAFHDPTGNEWLSMTETDEDIQRMYEGITAEPSACIIGNFDGVHKGHQYVIDRLKEIGRERRLRTIIVTFNSHPRTLFDKDFVPRYLTTIVEKTALLRQSGVDEVRVMPFTHEFANTTAHDFMEHYLRDGMGVKVLLLGYDNRFGKRNAEEDFQTYREYGRELGIDVILADAKDIEEQGKSIRVSSSHVRHLVIEGRMEEAAQCLGRPYSISGIVVHGREEGRKMGFPTANILPPERKLLPPNGAYETRVTIEGREDATPMAAMTNIGRRPTFDETGQNITIETNIFDFNEDLYNKNITIQFIRMIRPEQHFSSPEALRQQLEKDRKEVMSHNYPSQTK